MTRFNQKYPVITLIALSVAVITLLAPMVFSQNETVNSHQHDVAKKTSSVVDTLNVGSKKQLEKNLPRSSPVISLPNLGNVDEEVINLADERKIGAQITFQIKQKQTEFSASLVNDYLNEIGRGLIAQKPTPFDLEFFIVRDNSINAFALPGGYIGVNTNLILLCQSADELASVLAHEISHVTQRHLTRMLAQNKSLNLIGLASVLAGFGMILAGSPDSGMAMMYGGQGLSQSQKLRFSREAEHEADRIGFSLLNDAGYNPNAMPIFFGRLLQAARTSESNSIIFLRTHPLTVERIADMQNRAQTVTVPMKGTKVDATFELVQTHLKITTLETRLNLDNREVLAQQKIAFLQNLEKNKSDVSERYGLVLIALKEEDTATAEKWLTPLLNSEPNQAFFALANVQLLILKKEISPLLLKKYVQRFPKNYIFFQHYVDHLFETRAFNEVIQLVKREIQKKPEDVWAHEILAKAYAEQGLFGKQHMTLAQLYDLIFMPFLAVEQANLAFLQKDLNEDERLILKNRLSRYHEKAQLERRQQAKQSDQGNFQ